MIYLTGMGLIWLTAVRQPTATMRLMHVSTGMKSATMSGLKYFPCRKSAIKIFFERDTGWSYLAHIVRITPLPLAARMPVGPFRFSIQPYKKTNWLFIFHSVLHFHMLSCWVFVFACMSFPIMCDWYLDRPKRSDFVSILLLQLIVIVMRTPGIGSFQEATTILGLGGVWNNLLSNICWSR